ncbi:integrase core domain-containing protein [Phytohabitans sp. LJ34]|uniref:integrase core domain-containing protein n=1 Tax=Phytohabitans sp. LJ34 TaxID=3452217 RepID=UPI003F8C2AD7
MTPQVGSALDNAAAEAFNSIIKVEYIHRHQFRTRAPARLKIATWIVDFYNTRRSAQCLRRPTTYRLRAIDGRGREARSRITESSTISGGPEVGTRGASRTSGVDRG